MAASSASWCRLRPLSAIPRFHQAALLEGSTRVAFVKASNASSRRSSRPSEIPFSTQARAFSGSRSVALVAASSASWRRLRPRSTDARVIQAATFSESASVALVAASNASSWRLRSLNSCALSIQRCALEPPSSLSIEIDIYLIPRDLGGSYAAIMMWRTPYQASRYLKKVVRCLGLEARYRALRLALLLSDLGDEVRQWLQGAAPPE
jgi:hypothetical protein